MRFIWLTCLFLFASAAAGEVTLVRDGKPCAEIVLRSDAVSSAQLAAFELNHHIRLITGTELPVLRAASGKAETVIELGTEQRPFKEEYACVSVKPGKIRLWGYDAPRRDPVDYADAKTFPKGSLGTLFAAYDFLEKFCGVRWYAPGPVGTVCTPRRTLAVPEGENRVVSGTTNFRRLSPMRNRWTMNKFYGCTSRDVALFKKRWRTYEYSPGDQHNIYPIFYEYYAPAQRDPALRAIFKERKLNWFAQGYDGVMAPVDKYVRREYPNDVNLPPGICFSDPGPVKYFANMALRKYNGEKIVGLPRPYTPRLQGRPFYDAVNHMDATSVCRCAKCQAALAAGKSLQWQFIANVAREAAKLNPEINIRGGSYQDRAPFPKDVKFPPNTGVSLALGVHAWWNPDFYKIQHDEYYGNYLKHFGGRRMIVWLYLFGPSWDSLTRYKHKYFPGMYPRLAGKIVKEMARDGVTGAMLEVELEQNTLEAYLACMLFYNADLDVEKTIDEYFDKYYMEAAPEMRAFYAEIENAFCNWKNYPKDMFGPKGAAEKQRLNSLGSGMLTADRNWSVGTPERMAKLEKLFTQAEKKASPLVKKRLALLRKAFWDQALAGMKDNLLRQRNLKAPVKTATIPRIPDASGDPDRVDWEKAASIGDCHLITTGEEVPGAFLLRMAADRKYLYMELIDRRPITARGHWNNYLEIFLSRDGQMPVAQLGFGIGWKSMLAWKTDLINDAVNVSSVPPAEVYGANFKLIDEQKIWHWRAAFSLEKLFGPGPLDRFRMNLRRKTPENRLCWNRFFASSQDCLEPGILGSVLIRDRNRPEDLPFAQTRFRNEIGTWRMLEGFLRFTCKPGAAHVRFTGKKDGLIFNTPVAAGKGQSVTVSYLSSKDVALRIMLIPRDGVKRFPSVVKRAVKAGNGRFSAAFPPLKQGDAFTVVLSSDGPEEFDISQVQVSFK